MIEAQNIFKTYHGRTVLDNVSFQVKEKQTFVLLGTSGGGKTTALKTINRLIEPDSGKIYIDGKDASKEKPEILRRNMGYVLQRNSLFPHYTVLQNIAVVSELLHWKKKDIRDRAAELLHKLRLPEKYLDIYPRQLSGGEAQRVNLARALMTNPPILLMDEPFSALDTLTRKAIRKEFKALDELKNKTIVMVTHDVQEAFEMGNNICIINDGKIMQQGSAKELLENPSNDFVKSFLSDAYFSLSLSTITLEDIWQYLTELFSSNASTEIASNEPISTIIYRIEKDEINKSLLNIRNSKGETKTTDWEGVLQAFIQYKKHNS